MRYVIVAMFFYMAGYPLEPIYAAEQLTSPQMDQVTAGAFNFKRLSQFAAVHASSGCTATAASCTNGAAVASSSNTAVVSQSN